MLLLNLKLLLNLEFKVKNLYKMLILCFLQAFDFFLLGTAIS
jgi:hypothetical protein